MTHSAKNCTDGKGMAGGSCTEEHIEDKIARVGGAEAKRRIEAGLAPDGDERHGGYGHICSEVCDVWLLVELAEDYERLLGDGVTEDNQPDVLRRVRAAVESEQCERRGNWCHTHDRFAIACVRVSPAKEQGERRR